MRKKRKMIISPARSVPADIQALFGNAPLLSTEDPSLYWNMLDRFATCVEPKNIIEWLWVKDVLDLSWEIVRLRRFKIVWIESEREDRNAAIEWRREHATDPIESFMSEPRPPTREEIESRKHEPLLDTEADSVSLFCESVDRYECIDKLLTSAEFRRDRILREMDLRRDRTARLRRAPDEIIDASALAAE